MIIDFIFVYPNHFLNGNLVFQIGFRKREKTRVTDFLYISNQGFLKITFSFLILCFMSNIGYIQGITLYDTCQFSYRIIN